MSIYKPLTNNAVLRKISVKKLFTKITEAKKKEKETGR
jgi:hypothetical protein